MMMVHHIHVCIFHCSLKESKRVLKNTNQAFIFGVQREHLLTYYFAISGGLNILNTTRHKSTLNYNIDQLLSELNLIWPKRKTLFDISLFHLYENWLIYM